MGLDMSLNRRKIVRKKEVEKSLIYWRKVNAIHQWFVNVVQGGVDDCNEYEVTSSQLHCLLKICERISKDNSLASELLPTCSGFFFGGTEYGEYYFEQVDYTRMMLKKILTMNNGKMFYQSSW